MTIQLFRSSFEGKWEGTLEIPFKLSEGELLEMPPSLLGGAVVRVVKTRLLVHGIFNGGGRFTADQIVAVEPSEEPKVGG